MSPPGLVTRPEDVTSAFLTDVLNYSGIDAKVEHFTQSNVGTGQVGQNVRFQMTYATDSDPSAPASIVGKFCSDDEVSRQTGVGLANYLREVRFYQELRASLDIQTPKVLFTDINPETHQFVLMMEDLAPAVQGNQLEGCSVADVKLGLEELAKLHGPRWADESLFDLEWLPRPDPDAGVTIAGLYNQLFPGFVERYGSRLNQTHIDLGKHLGDNFARHVANGNRDHAMTVTHGDYRLDNTMFGGPYPLAVVDWQSPTIGNNGQDLAYWVGTSLPSDIRRKSDRALVEHYYQSLTHYDVGDYSLEQCWLDYRQFAFSGWNMAVIASMIVGQTDRGDDMFMVMANRSAQMATDLESLNLLD